MWDMDKLLGASRWRSWDGYSSLTVREELELLEVLDDGRSLDQVPIRDRLAAAELLAEECDRLAKS